MQCLKTVQDVFAPPANSEKSEEFEMIMLHYSSWFAFLPEREGCKLRVCVKGWSSSQALHRLESHKVQIAVTFVLSRY